MKFFFTALLLACSLTAYSQLTVDLTEDLVLSETLVITEDVTYNGNGFRIVCEGCEPAILVKNGARVHFEGVFFPKNYAKWIQVEGAENANVTWNSPLMRGYIRTNNGGND